MESSENPIIITLDLHDCKYAYDIHQRIKETFGFPDWYGRNWSAFDDLLYAPGEYTVVQIRGYNTLPKNIATYCITMIEIFKKKREYYEEISKKQDNWKIRFDYKIID